MQFFDDLISATTPNGTITGVSLGIVANTDDPEQMQRIQVYDMTKGGTYVSDWMFRLLPFTQFSPPLPKLNDLVLVGYINGDPHQGCYLGLMVNKKNVPVGANNDFTIVVGGTKISLTLAGDVAVEGAKSVSINASDKVTVESAELVFKAGSVDFQDCSSFKVGGKQVATLGAKDNTGDTIVTKGW